MSGDDVCSSVVFGTLVGVFVFSVMWSELLMTSAISCPLWSSVYECQKVEGTFISPVRTECGMFVMMKTHLLHNYVCDVLYSVLYVRVSCFVVRRYAVSRMYIHVCHCDMVLLMCTLTI